VAVVVEAVVVVEPKLVVMAAVVVEVAMKATAVLLAVLEYQVKETPAAIIYSTMQAQVVAVLVVLAQILLTAVQAAD
jgi:hypothetical protein